VVPEAGLPPTDLSRLILGRVSKLCLQHRLRGRPRDEVSLLPSSSLRPDSDWRKTLLYIPTSKERLPADCLGPCVNTAKPLRLSKSFFRGERSIKKLLNRIEQQEMYNEVVEHLLVRFVKFDNGLDVAERRRSLPLYSLWLTGKSVRRSVLNGDVLVRIR
jgi:hypothetical protein